MRTLRTILISGLAAALALGLAAGPADANMKAATSTDGELKITVTASDVLTAKGAFSVTNWLTFAVDVPDDYVSTGGAVVKTEWRVTITPRTGTGGTCPEYTLWYPSVTSYYKSDGTYSIPLKGTGWTANPAGGYYYWGSGSCVMDVKVSAYRKGDYDQGITAWSADATATSVFYYNRTRSTATVAAPTTVTRNKAFVVSGVAKYQKPSAAFAYAPMPRTSKVSVQFRRGGTTTWTTIKSTYVTDAYGRFATSVVVPASGSLRTVVATTSKVKIGASGARAVYAK